MSGCEMRHPRVREWLSGTARERRERARLLRRLGECSECRHPWSEHPGTENDFNDMCGECAYEFEHDQRESSAPGCRLPCPALD
jgi:hypothetical protein